MKTAPNLALVGPMGAGKSSVAGLLAPRLGLRLVDLDAWMEQDAGMSVEAMFQRHGEPGFRERERDALSTLLAGSGLLLATGGGAVLDAGNRERLGRRAFVLHLHATPDEQWRRLQGDRHRPLLQCEDPATRLRQLATVRNPLYAMVADYRLDTTGLSAAQVAQRAQAILGAQWRPGQAA